MGDGILVSGDWGIGYWGFVMEESVMRKSVIAIH